ELLVVIAIIATLAAILFPVFARTRRTARRTQCVSNMRQIGIAVQSYMVDWDERFPAAYTDDAVWVLGKHPSLPECLSAYIKTPWVWRCPSDTGETFTK